MVLFPILLSGFRGVQGAIGETCPSTPWWPLLLGLGTLRVIPRAVLIGIPSLSELGPRRILYPESLSHCPRQILLLPPGVACRHTDQPASLGLLRVTVGIPALSRVCLGQALQIPKGGAVLPRVSTSWPSSPREPLPRPRLLLVARTRSTGKGTFPSKVDIQPEGTGNLVEAGA